jgi:hypothetical protein
LSGEQQAKRVVVLQGESWIVSNALLTKQKTEVLCTPAGAPALQAFDFSSYPTYANDNTAL